MNNPARGDDNWPIELSQWPLWRGILSQISHLIIRQWRAGSDGEPRGRKNARNSFYSSGWRWAEEGMEQGVPQTFGLFPTSNHIHLQEWGSRSGHSCMHCWIRSTENSVPIYGGLVFPKFSNLPEVRNAKLHFYWGWDSSKEVRDVPSNSKYSLSCTGSSWVYA